MPIERSCFASMTTPEFTAYLEDNGIEPNKEERTSVPQGREVIMKPGFEISILAGTMQRFGLSISEGTTK